MYLTRVLADVRGDVRFPEFDVGTRVHLCDGRGGSLLVARARRLHFRALTSLQRLASAPRLELHITPVHRFS